MSGRASRRKGKRGELEVVDILRAAGFDARRTPNSGGLSWPGDVQGVEGYVFEVKRTERLNLSAALRQAYGGARGGAIPVVAWRRSGRGNASEPLLEASWHAVLPLYELARLLSVASGMSPGNTEPSPDGSREAGMSPGDTKEPGEVPGSGAAT